MSRASVSALRANGCMDLGREARVGSVSRRRSRCGHRSRANLWCPVCRRDLSPLLERGRASVASGLWPEWCDNHPWLASFLAMAEEEARERASHTIEDFHFFLALTRVEAGAQQLLEELGFDSRRLRDRLNVRFGINAGILMERSQRTDPGASDATLDELYWRGPLDLTNQVRDTLRTSRLEAEKHDATVGPGHLIAGLSRRGRPLGVGLARIRRTAGIPHQPRVLAAGVDRTSIRRPLGIGPLVLGGGDELHLVAADVVALAKARGVSDPLVVGVFASAMSFDDSMSDETRLQLMRPFAAAGARVMDSGLTSRADSSKAKVLDALASADILYLSGGRPELLIDAVLGTPAYEAFVVGSDRGAIVMGSSAGSMVLGRGMLSDHESEDDEEPLDLFNWLTDIVVLPHYVESGEATLRRWVKSFPGSRAIGVSHQGAVLVEPGWEALVTLACGVDAGPVELQHSDGPLKPIGPSRTSDASGL